MSLLTVENLNLSINGTEILQDVSLIAEAGKIVAIIGESGSGKSMTAYCINQLLPRGAVASGQVMFDGSDMLTTSETDLCNIRGQDIGMVFQEPMTALNPVQTIGAQVAETVMIHSGARKTEALITARKTLNRCGLPEAEFPLGRFPHELSGGQRQRVVIAMAIALQPKLLIADEPTTALDVTTQAQILDLLKKLVREDNMALVLISHDLAVVADIADNIVIMRKGEVVERGPTKQVFSQMSHQYTRDLFEASGHVPSRMAKIQETPILKISNLVRDYVLPRKSVFGKPPLLRAVDNVSFTLKRGESLGLVGESGCGKSTLTRAILGLDVVQSGAIEIDGHSVNAGHKVPRHLRRKMQVVFQDPYGSFNPRHKVARLVAEPFHLIDDAPSGQQRRLMVEKALIEVGMQASDADKYIHEFSGGQRQRIAIARALIIKPELIILDEAVSALDVSIRAQILDLLAEFSETLGLSYLFISHDLNVVKSITDRVIVMKSGAIVEMGDTQTVFNTPRHSYTKALISAAPVLETIS